MPKIEERVAAIETAAKHLKLTIGILVPTLLLWGAYITKNVISIKQALADQGTRLVAQLNSAKSPEELRATLSTVTAQVQTSQVDHKTPDPKKTMALSTAVARVIHNDPQIPEAWEAASALISFRFSNHEPIKSVPCGSSPENIMIPPLDPQHSLFEQGIRYHDCTVTLDDALEIIDSKDYKLMSKPIQPLWRFGIVFQNVHVIYRGGKVLPANVFVFSNCTFEFQMNIPPSAPSGRSLTSTLLATTDTSKVTVVLPSQDATPS